MDTYAINEEKFTSIEDAKRAYEKINNLDTGFIPWFKWVIKSFITPILIVNGIPIPIFHIILNGFTRWLALPGSVGDQIRRCDKFIKECDKAIASSEGKSKKDLEKLRDEANKKKEVYLRKEKELGSMSLANTIFATEASSIYLNNDSESVYNYSSIYEEYITNKITNEEAIASKLSSIIPMNEAAYKNIRAINEAKISDKIKAKFNKIIAFVKNLLAKFMESISNILLGEKEYLEKYKDIITKKQPKSENEYSYTGDYKTAVQRCINFNIPVFNYKMYAKDLQQNDNDAATAITVNKIMQGEQGFTFNNGDSIAEQFKEYFLAWDKGETSGTFDDGKLNFTDMYNFCIKVKDIETIKKKDENYIETTTKAITTAIEQAIAKNQTTQTQQQPTQQQVQQNSAYMYSALSDSRTKYLSETNTGSANNNDQSSNNQSNNSNNQSSNNNNNANNNSSNGTNTLKVTSAVTKIKNDSSQRNNLSNDEINKYSSGGENDEVTMVQRAGDRWLIIVRTIIAARCTALQQIAKNYMEIIRVHVRSYVGNEKDKTTNRTQDPEINYENGNNNIDNNGKYKNKIGQKNVERHRKKLQEK